EIMPADDLATLAESMNMAVNGSQIHDAGPWRRQELKMDRQEGLGDDMQPGRGQERMNVRDPAGDRVLDRDHPEFGRAVLNCREGVLEGRAGERAQVRIIVEASDVRIGPGFALIGDRTRLIHAYVLGASMARARSRSPIASTPSGAVSTSAMSMRMPVSSARNCSSFSRRSRGEGGRATNRLSASRR